METYTKKLGLLQIKTHQGQYLVADTEKDPVATRAYADILAKKTVRVPLSEPTGEDENVSLEPTGEVAIIPYKSIVQAYFTVAGELQINKADPYCAENEGD